MFSKGTNGWKEPLITTAPRVRPGTVISNLGISLYLKPMHLIVVLRPRVWIGAEFLYYYFHIVPLAVCLVLKITDRPWYCGKLVKHLELAISNRHLEITQCTPSMVPGLESQSQQDQDFESETWLYFILIKTTSVPRIGPISSQGPIPYPGAYMNKNRPGRRATTAPAFRPAKHFREFHCGNRKKNLKSVGRWWPGCNLPFGRDLPKPSVHAQEEEIKVSLPLLTIARLLLFLEVVQDRASR